jgi:thioredoxin-related protein
MELNNKTIKTMNKLICTLVVVLSITLSSNAQESGKWYTSLEEAAKVSMTTGKPIMANFTGSDWCGWCKKLKKEVFDKTEFKNWANENIVLLDVDFPRRVTQTDELKKQNRELQQMFKVGGYPTIHVFNVVVKDGKLQLDPIKKSGYVAGGPKPFIESISVKN